MDVLRQRYTAIGSMLLLAPSPINPNAYVAKFSRRFGRTENVADQVGGLGEAVTRRLVVVMSTPVTRSRRDVRNNLVYEST